MQPVPKEKYSERRVFSAKFLALVIGFLFIFFSRLLLKALITKDTMALIALGVMSVILLWIPLVIAVLLYKQVPIERFDSVAWWIGGVLTMGMFVTFLAITMGFLTVPFKAEQASLSIFFGFAYTTMMTGSALTLVRHEFSPEQKKD